MFCGPEYSWGGWHVGGWFMLGFFILIFIAIIAWLLFRRQPSPVGTDLRCPKCSGGILASYFRCPYCGETLKHNCPNCSKVIEKGWAYCPYCNENQVADTTDNKGVMS